MAGGEKLKVFISYSRKDSGEFADELLAGLQLAGFAPFLDRHDIAAGEDWEARLDSLIQEADTVVFVVSPGAVKSERCGWESERTLALSKRLLPVIFKPVPETDIPHLLRRLQFVRFDTGSGLARPLLQLAEALRQDVDWIREHTRLGEIAARWQARGRPDSLLLRGDDLDAAKTWVGQRSAEAPEITDQQGAFVDASEKAEAARIAELRLASVRERRVQVLVGVLVAAMVVGLAAWRYEQWIKEGIYWLTDVRGEVLTVQQERALKPKEIFKECTNCPEMVVVAAGEFLMGSSATEMGRYVNERPQHRVTIAAPFAVGRFAVTFDEWDACAAHGNCDQHTSDAGWGRGRKPVINVNWDDAQRYVTWLSKTTGRPYRLLTEAEWEYAARAGTTTAYWWGNEIGKGNANCDGCGSKWDQRTSPVDSFKPNSFGLHAMAGNVWQWIEDSYHDNYDGAPADGSVWTNGDRRKRVVRGGSWLNGPQDARSAFRSWGSADGRIDHIGFRVARTLTP